jgi:heme A synthase
MFAVLALLYAATGAAIAWFALSRTTGKTLSRFDGVVAPFFGAVGVLFSLLTGFLAGDIADRNRQAVRAVQTEAGELRNIHMLSIASVSDMRNIRAALADYANKLVRDEWPAMSEDRAAPSATAAYDELLRQVSDPKIAQVAGAAVPTALLNAAVRAGTARSDRLALAADRTNDIKWALVLILGVMTQLSIALVHLQKRNPQIAALTVFSIAAVIALGLLALQERPFAGDVYVPPGPLLEVAKLPAE